MKSQSFSTSSLLSVPAFVWCVIHHTEHDGLVYAHLCVVWDPPCWIWWACLCLPLCGLGSTTVNTMGFSVPTLMPLGIHHSEHDGLSVPTFVQSGIHNNEQHNGLVSPYLCAIWDPPQWTMGLSIPTCVWFGIHHGKQDELISPYTCVTWDPLYGCGSTSVNTMGLSIPTFVWFGIHHSENGGHTPWKWACLSLPFVYFRILYPSLCVVWDPPQWTQWACQPLPLWDPLQWTQQAYQSLPLCHLVFITVNTMDLSIPTFVQFGIQHSEHDGLVSSPCLCVAWDPSNWTQWVCQSLPLCAFRSTTVSIRGLSIQTFLWFKTPQWARWLISHYLCVVWGPLYGLGSTTVNTMGLSIHHSEQNGLVYPQLCVVWDPPHQTWWACLFLHSCGMGSTTSKMIIGLA